MLRSGGFTGKNLRMRLSEAFMCSMLLSALTIIALHHFDVTVMLDIKELTVTQYQFDALVCFAFNVSVNAVDKSTLMKKLIVGDIQEATNEFLRWNKANGKELEGLNRRRQAKRRLFLSDISVC